eukprot:568528-Prymnesium_polylepis.2
MMCCAPPCAGMTAPQRYLAGRPRLLRQWLGDHEPATPQVIERIRRDTGQYDGPREHAIFACMVCGQAS